MRQDTPSAPSSGAAGSAYVESALRTSTEHEGAQPAIWDTSPAVCGERRPRTDDGASTDAAPAVLASAHASSDRGKRRSCVLPPVLRRGTLSHGGGVRHDLRVLRARTAERTDVQPHS